ncbi:MAG: MobP3 family relaxase [Oscillospiraceae bacterium]|nr:relaxase MobL [Clostridiales bacterium]
MSKLIQKAGFLNPKRAGRYMNYIATRDGVELLDENADSIYMRYIATRPRAEKHGEHGLFGAEDAVDLEKTLGELKAHEGNVWTIIYSLRREDAARLGYDNAASWRALLRSKQAGFAEAMQIPPSQLRWYAAFHDEGDHPHIHMMLWSDDPKCGFLRKDKLLHLQSVLTNMIYADELKEVYVQKDIAYKDVTEAARAAMRRIIDQLESVENPPESIQKKLLELALELRTATGKKQYGYLKKPLKDMVDFIVDELEKMPEVAAYYSVWNDLRDTLEGYYKNRPRQHNSLSQQKEFRAIKNAIIQEAERLRLQLEESSAQASANPLLTDEHISSITSQFARLPSEYLLNSTVRLFHQMGQIFRDNAAPPSNPMGIRIDSKRRKKLMQKRLAMGHKQDDHEQTQDYEQRL